MFKSLTQQECLVLLQANYIGYLGYIYKNQPYIVPMTYFYNKENDAIICYSSMGHKIEAMRKNNTVSFEVSEIESVKNWKSVLLQGTYEELTGSSIKHYLHVFSEGVKNSIKKRENRKVDFISEFSSKLYTDSLPTTFLIRINNITGKRRSYDDEPHT